MSQRAITNKCIHGYPRLLQTTTTNKQNPETLKLFYRCFFSANEIFFLISIRILIFSEDTKRLSYILKKCMFIAIHCKGVSGYDKIIYEISATIRLSLCLKFDKVFSYKAFIVNRVHCLNCYSCS